MSVIYNVASLNSDSSNDKISGWEMPSLANDRSILLRAIRELEQASYDNFTSNRYLTPNNFSRFNHSNKFQGSAQLDIWSSVRRGGQILSANMETEEKSSWSGDSPYLHSIVINGIGFTVEVGALISNLCLLFYTFREIWVKMKPENVPSHFRQTDICFGFAFHLSIIGFLMSVFMLAMHSLIIYRNQDHPTCVFYLYLRDTLASLYLYLLVIHFLVYLRVTYPPRVPHSSREKAVVALLHSLPWVVAVGASLPICIMNLGVSLMPDGYLEMDLSQQKASESYSLAIAMPVQGLCMLNTKHDVKSLFLEVVQLTIPVMMSLGIFMSVALQRGPLLGSSSNLTIISFSRNLILLSSGLTILTQAPFSFSRLVVGILTIRRPRTLMNHTLLRYFTQLHIIQFAVNPVVIIVTLILLQSAYRKAERFLEKYQQESEPTLRPIENHHDEMMPSTPEILYTNCMLTTV